MAVTYIQVSDVQNALGAAYDATSQVYTVYGLTLTAAAFQAHVSYANIYINALVGTDITSADPRYNHAVIAAIDLACFRILVVSSGGAIVGAFDYFLGDLRVSRAGPYAAAVKNAINGFLSDLTNQIINLTTPVLVGDAAAAQDVPTYEGGLINP
jgi:hypothetical protein